MSAKRLVKVPENSRTRRMPGFFPESSQPNAFKLKPFCKKNVTWSRKVENFLNVFKQGVSSSE
jgi:hypothetical protein